MTSGAKHGGSRRRTTGAKKPAKRPHPASRPKAARVAPPAPEPPAPGPFRLGAVAGATPGKWIDTWHRRMLGVGLDLIPLAAAQQRSALMAAEVDAAIVRLPIERDALHV